MQVNDAIDEHVLLEKSDFTFTSTSLYLYMYITEIIGATKWLLLGYRSFANSGRLTRALDKDGGTVRRAHRREHVPQATSTTVVRARIETDGDRQAMPTNEKMCSSSILSLALAPDKAEMSRRLVRLKRRRARPIVLDENLDAVAGAKHVATKQRATLCRTRPPDVKTSGERPEWFIIDNGPDKITKLSRDRCTALSYCTPLMT